MKCPKLKNKANSTRQKDDIMKYKRQQNLVAELIRNSKLRYFDITEISKNPKTFWNECKPYFSNKQAYGDFKMLLIEKEKITNSSYEAIKKTLLVNKNEIAKSLNKHFAETVGT